ncbi:MAG: heavy-metal-associated domain-containing protein [Bacteroidales bacterium]|nr:heavy-metal-associated domain-containing protein [Bacteroidales bacterium]
MKRLIILAISVLLFTTASFAQEDKKVAKQETTTISLDKLCCESSFPIIEKTLAYERGVESWKISLEDKNVEVVYKTKKTNPTKIAKALAKSGFEANGIEADKRAIEKLPNCCKETAKGNPTDCHHH